MKKKAKLSKHNSFKIVEEGEFVNCAVSGREIPLDKLTYWNVDLQEVYFSPIEVNKRLRDLKKKL